MVVVVVQYSKCHMCPKHASQWQSAGSRADGVRVRAACLGVQVDSMSQSSPPLPPKCMLCMGRVGDDYSTPIQVEKVPPTYPPPLLARPLLDYSGWPLGVHSAGSPRGGS